MGIHFEGMGDVWEAMFAEGTRGVATCIAKTTSEGVLRKRCQVLYQEEETHIALLQYPEQADIQSAVLLVKTKDAQNMQLWSAYPLLHGIPNTLEITHTHTWSNGVEGVVAAHLVEDGPLITFFVPFYFRDFTTFTPGAKLTVSLGALAFSLKKANAMNISVDEGPLYETLGKDFLTENSGKKEKDFPAEKLELTVASLLLSSDYVCEWTYRCPVLAVEHIAVRLSS